MKAVIAAALSEMVRECFEEGQGVRHFTGLSADAALFANLSKLDAAQASTRIHPRLNTVVAHTRHLLEAISGSNRWAATGAFEADFGEAWLEQEASPARWDELRQRLASEYEALMGWLSDGERLDDANLRWTLAILPHCAYHLGAIVQLTRIITTS